MKRKQKRYESEQEILDKIDTVQERLRLLIIEAEGCGNEYRLLEINKAARRIQDATLPRLKNTLAAFRTATMPFCGEDKAVVLK